MNLSHKVFLTSVMFGAKMANASSPTPEMKVTSNILGMADTGNKTTLKVDLIYTHGPSGINLYHYDDESLSSL